MGLAEESMRTRRQQENVYKKTYGPVPIAALGKRVSQMKRAPVRIFGVNETTINELKKLKKEVADQGNLVILPPSIDFLREVAGRRKSDRVGCIRISDPADLSHRTSVSPPAEGPMRRVFGREAFGREIEEAAMAVAGNARDADELQKVPVLSAPSVAFARPFPKAKRKRPEPSEAPRPPPEASPFGLTEDHRQMVRQLLHEEKMSEVLMVAARLDAALEGGKWDEAIVLVTYLDSLSRCLTHEMLQLAGLGPKVHRAAEIGSRRAAIAETKAERLKLKVLEASSQKFLASARETVVRSAQEMAAGGTRAAVVLNILLADAAMSQEQQQRGEASRKGASTGSGSQVEEEASMPMDKWRRFGGSIV